MIHRISFDTKNNLFFLNFINTKSKKNFSAPGFNIYCIDVFKFKKQEINNQNNIQPRSNNKNIRKNNFIPVFCSGDYVTHILWFYLTWRYYKVEKRGYWDEKKFYIFLNFCPQFPFNSAKPRKIAHSHSLISQNVLFSRCDSHSNNNKKPDRLENHTSACSGQDYQVYAGN